MRTQTFSELSITESSETCPFNLRIITRESELNDSIYDEIKTESLPFRHDSVMKILGLNGLAMSFECNTALSLCGIADSGLVVL